MTTIRFFAAARAAVGADDATVGADVTVLGDALDAVVAADPARWAQLRERCSYLVDGLSTRDPATSLAGVDTVDVMPPFAGG